MLSNIRNYDLINACYTIFGPLFHYSKETLNYLESSGIKKAYREKAMLYHPDRVKITGFTDGNSTTRFNELNNAYKILLNYININKKINDRNTHRGYYANYSFVNINTAKKKSEFKSDKDVKKQDFYHIGNTPNRKLRLGEFLYYSKLISWRTLISSIVHQYKMRPKIGDLCCKMNFLTRDEINNILRNIKYSEKFGETAVRLGFLSSYNVMVTLGVQKKINLPIGRYFIDNNIFTETKLNEMLVKNKEYNLKVNNKQI